MGGNKKLKQNLDKSNEKLPIFSLLCFFGIHKKTLIWENDFHSKYECSRCKSKFIHEHQLGGTKYKVG
jgi:hypothetical protein